MSSRCNAVVFAVGDKVDETVGLPYKSGMFVTNPNKTGNDPDDALFQAYDETTGKIVDGVFLAGWARKASEGLSRYCQTGRGLVRRSGDADTSRREASRRKPLDVKVVLDKLRCDLQAHKSRPRRSGGTSCT